MGRQRVAFFDFSCCEGCQLQVANLGEALLDVLNAVEVVAFREVMSEKSNEYDIAIVEGSITTPHDVDRIGQIRKIARVLVAYGSCATIGGVNGMKNAFDLDEIRRYVYGADALCFPTIPTRPVHQVVPVDYFVNGCPVYQPEFVKVLTCILMGVPYEVPDVAVCTECKCNENICMFEKGVTCLGPITRAGCNAWCINNGNTCYGCRGMVSNPATRGQMDILQRYGITPEQVMRRLTLYNQVRETECDGQKRRSEC